MTIKSPSGVQAVHSCMENPVLPAKVTGVYPSASQQPTLLIRHVWPAKSVAQYLEWCVGHCGIRQDAKAATAAT